MVRGQRPEFLYNPQTDSYDRYPGGIEGLYVQAHRQWLIDHEEDTGIPVTPIGFDDLDPRGR